MVAQINEAFLNKTELTCLPTFYNQSGGNAVTTHLMVQSAHYYLLGDVLYRNSAKT